MNLQERVMEALKKNAKPMDIKRLARRLDIDLDHSDELIKVLYELENEGKIIGNGSEYAIVPTEYYLTFGSVHHSAKDNYYIKLEGGTKILIDDRRACENLKEGDKVFVETRPSNKHKKQLFGKIVRIVSKASIDSRNFLFRAVLKKSHSNNYFYVEFNNRKYYIPDDSVKGAYIGDEVTVEGMVIDDNYVGVIKDIIKRKTNRHVFTVKSVDGVNTLIPIGTVYYDIKPNFDVNDFHDGEELLLEIDDDYNANFIKTLEIKDGLDNKIRALAYDSGIPVDFANRALKEAQNITGEISESEEKRRIDLRNLLTVTIDGDSAKDLDDAVSVEKLEDRYRLYVSIADVSYYVYPGTSLFEAALERGTSIYPANSVIPMLPTELSNGVCSLNEGEDKLTKTCIVDIDFDGNILDHRIVNSIIRSNKRMSYANVNKVIAGMEVEGYGEYKELIDTLKGLSDILDKRRIDRGFIRFLNSELKFEFDNDNNICGIQNKESGEAERIIENCMLIANECVAELAFNLGTPFVYRNHDIPSISKIYQLKYKIKGFHKYLSSLSSAQNPKILQRIFNSICEGKSEYEVEFMSKLILKSMSRAFYASENIGHYGLALDVYATFTSPIRRLPDLLNHIILNYIIEEKYDELDQFIDDYAAWAYTATEKQLEAETFENNVDIMLIQKYTEGFIGVPLVGRIVFIYDDRVYIETNTGLYGYIALNHNNIHGSEIRINHNKYKIGSTIDVMIDAHDERDQELRFIIIDEKKDVKNDVLEKKLERSE